jgi:hypothetical protein
MTPEEREAATLLRMSYRNSPFYKNCKRLWLLGYLMVPPTWIADFVMHNHTEGRVFLFLEILFFTPYVLLSAREMRQIKAEMRSLDAEIEDRLKNILSMLNTPVQAPRKKPNTRKLQEL